MGFKSMEWAYQIEIKPSTQKFLFVTLAYHMSEKGQSWPSVATLARETGLNRKTVLDGLKALEEAGLIVNTQDKKGGTGRVKVYTIPVINGTEIGTITPNSNGTDFGHNGTDFGTITTKSNGTNFGHKQSQFRTVMVPKSDCNGTDFGTQKGNEYSLNTQETREALPVVVAESVYDWGGFGTELTDAPQVQDTLGNTPVEPLPATPAPTRAKLQSDAQIRRDKADELIRTFLNEADGVPLDSPITAGFFTRYRPSAFSLLDAGATPEGIRNAVKNQRQAWPGQRSLDLIFIEKEWPRLSATKYSPPTPPAPPAPSHTPEEWAKIMRDMKELEDARLARAAKYAAQHGTVSPSSGYRLEMVRPS